MPAGNGALDAQGIWQFGESDTGVGNTGYMSDILNLLAQSVSSRFAGFSAAADLGYSSAIAGIASTTSITPAGSVVAAWLRREGKRVSLRGGFTVIKSSAIPAWATVATLTDSTLRPGRTTGGTIVMETGKVCGCEITTTGSINTWDSLPNPYRGFFIADWYVD